MIAIRRIPRTAMAVVLLMALQIGGCAVIGSGDLATPIFCTASVPNLVWLASIQSLLLAGFAPFGLVALAVPRLRPFAIGAGILALAGLAMQYLLMANGSFYCDAF